VVEALLLLHNFFRPDVSAALSISISRDDLAALMSTAKETASRLLSEFRDEGLIATKGSRITILNIEKLRKLSGSRK
jgi:CRP-like cAMP-binding protein